MTNQVMTQLTLIKDTMPKLPELFLDIHVVGDDYEQARFAQMFVPMRCSKAELPEDADLVVFTGGADINPALYGEDPHSSTIFDDRRDTADIEVYQICLDKGIPMLGICRGAQFIWAMNGGKLYQDVDNHNTGHSMYCHHTKKFVERVSSVHHQMCMRTPGMEATVLATSAKATERWCNPTRVVTGNESDIEAYFIRDVAALGIQGHPEYAGYPDFTLWTGDIIQDLIVHNPDVYLDKEAKAYRIKPDIVEQRNQKWSETIAIPEQEIV